MRLKDVEKMEVNCENKRHIAISGFILMPYWMKLCEMKFYYPKENEQSNEYDARLTFRNKKEFNQVVAAIKNFQIS